MGTIIIPVAPVQIMFRMLAVVQDLPQGPLLMGILQRLHLPERRPLLAAVTAATAVPPLVWPVPLVPLLAVAVVVAVKMRWVLQVLLVRYHLRTRRGQTLLRVAHHPVIRRVLLL